MNEVPEILKVEQSGGEGIVITFSDGKVGSYSAALLVSLYVESKEVRNRQQAYTRLASQPRLRIVPRASS